MKIGLIMNTITLGLTATYLVFATFNKSPNPKNWTAEFRQELERKAQSEKESVEKRATKLDNLVNNVLRKAQYSDGQAGLSFADKSQLAYDLGYTGICEEKMTFFLGRKPNNSPSIKDELILSINYQSFVLYERDLQRYLEKNCRSY